MNARNDPSTPERRREAAKGRGVPSNAIAGIVGSCAGFCAVGFCAVLAIACTTLNSQPGSAGFSQDAAPAQTGSGGTAGHGVTTTAGSGSGGVTGNGGGGEQQRDASPGDDLVPADNPDMGDLDGQDGSPGDADFDPCRGVLCESPPDPFCPDSGRLRRFAAVGSCGNGVCAYQPDDTVCPFGCMNGACSPDPCVGVSCNRPPANTCEDATHIRAYNTTGGCSAGTCSYDSQLVPCTCLANACVVDPCAAVVCQTPPAASCTDAHTLHTSAAAGTCAGGSCSYAATDTPCTFGCSSGRCNIDPCLATICNQPPAATCLDADTLRTYAPDGTCSGAGLCSYTPTDTGCLNGCVGGRCLGIIRTPPPCFPAGTPITMADFSTMPIELIKRGDRVLAYDPVTGASAPGRVLETFVHPVPAGSTLIRINDRLLATPEHPFFRNGAWSPAEQLAVGDSLLRVQTRAGTRRASFASDPVTSVFRETISTETRVYNLEVDELHDYFAGETLVHNKIAVLMAK